MKRKASLSTILSPRSSTSFYDRTVSPIPCSIGDAMVIDDTPQHLHSRTRKRFRNDRPDEQAVYDNTLRWLFSAQRQAENHGLYPEPITSIDDSLESLEEDSSFQEDSTTSLPKPDPSQKTLHHFFRHASAPARVSLAEANGNKAATSNNTDTNPSLSTSTHIMSSQVPSSSSTSVGDTSLPSATSGAGPCNGTDTVECEDIDMDRDTHTFTASATALTPAFQQRAWMDGKDLTQPSSCYYLLS
ncbi:hypothetical protein A7D00_2737 [Trichophyton violaceum]|uniref:Uncharacterized protein n=1 Tax=Trichophyton violaceum TaxID=34388 RepID=A0A178FLM9_TRIVO|nr:hypothetical protein A7D00_2737 [Trichophyton violaceum]